MQTETSIEIDRPIEQVFDLTKNHVAEWSTIVVEDEIIEDKNGDVGTRFRVVTEERGQRMEFDGIVTSYDPPNSASSRLVGLQFDIDVVYLFEDLGGRTKVTQVSEVTGKGFTKIMLALTGWMMKKSSCKAQYNELEGLKAFVEAS